MAQSDLNHVAPTSTKKQLRSISERVGLLESTIPQVVSGINQAMVQVDSTMGEFREAFDAVAEVLTGLGLSLADTIKARAQRRAEEAAKAQEAELTQRLTDGTLAPAATVTEKSLLVGTEADKDGGPVGAGRVQLDHAKLKPEFQTALLGQSVGFTMDLPHGGKFTLTGIYTAVEKPAEQAPACDPSACETCEGCPMKGEAESSS